MNRSGHFIAVLVALAYTVSPAFFGLAAIPSWEQRGGGPGHSFYVDVDLNPSLFKPAWTALIGYPQSATGSWYEYGVATDGQYVFRTQLEGNASSGKYHVIAFDLATGHEEWHQIIQGGAPEGVGEPSVANGTVYVNRAGHSGVGPTPLLYALDADTGVVKHTWPYQAQFASNDRATTVPGHVIAGGGYFGGMYSFNPNGNQNWFASQSFSTHPQAAVFGDKVFAFGSRIYSLATGQLITHIRPSDFLSSPLISDSGSVFYETRFGELEAFDATTLEFRREYTFPSPVYAKAVGNGVIAVAATSTNQLFMVDEATGNEISRWSPTNGELLSGEIILTNTHVFAIQWPGTYSLSTIHAINIHTGQSEWSAQFLPQIGYMALGDGYLFMSNNGSVLAYSMVPEPTSASMLGIGLVAAAQSCRSRRRRRQMFFSPHDKTA